MTSRFAPVIVVVGLLLGGCEGILGGMGATLVTGIGGGALESVETKKRAIMRWQIEKTRLVSKITDRMETYAAKLFARGDDEAGIAVLREIIVFHDENQPLWLVQKYIRRRATDD